MQTRRRTPVARLVALAVIATLLVPVAGRSASQPGFAGRRPAPADAFISMTKSPGGTAVKEPARWDPWGSLAEARKELGSGAHGTPLLMAATRTRLEHTLGRPIPHALRGLPQPGTDMTVYEDVLVDRFLAPAGDLDGDGNADVVAYEWKVRFAYDDETDEFTYEVLQDSVTARRGTDGSILWTLDLTAAQGGTIVFPLLLDLDDDGRADLMRLSIDDGNGEDIPCVIVACAGSARYAYHWTVEPQDGLTRAPLWTKTYPGTATVTGLGADALVAWGGAYVVDATAAYLDVAIAGDHDADGRPDVLVTAYDESASGAYAGVWALLAYAFAGYTPYSIGAHATVLKSGDGSVLFERRQPAEDNKRAAVTTTGDMSGDGNSDLLWIVGQRTASPFACAGVFIGTCAGSSAFTVQLESIDAATGQSRWTSDIDDAGLAGIFYVSAPLDATGDGKQDLPLDIYTTDPVDGEKDVLALFSGADGMRTWNRTFDYYSFAGLLPLGPVGGAAGDDLGLITWAGQETEIGFEMTRLDGADGSALFSTLRTVTVDWNAWISLLGMIGDFDGDGSIDLLVEVIQEFTDEEWNWIGARSDAATDSSRTGALIYSASVEAPVVWFSSGDLDADGDSDLVRVAYDLPARTVESTALLMPSGSAEWSRSDTFSADAVYFGAAAYPVANIDGAPGDEVQFLRGETEYTMTGSYGRARVDVLSGPDGTVLWAFGDAVGGPPPPPPGPPGAIAGTVSDTSGPLEGIRVFVSRPGMSPLAPALTDAAGAYEFASLPPGSYTVLFDDETNRHADEWYDNATTLESATPVIVVSNATTTANAVLSLFSRPENDDIASAYDVISLPYFDRQQTGGATTEAEEETWCGAGTSVWYRHTATYAPGFAVASARSADSTPAVAVYEGDDPSSLSLVTCADGSSEGAEALFFTYPRRTYWIQVGSAERGGDTFFQLNRTLF